MNDPVSDALLAIILVCNPLLILFVPRDPFIRRWSAQRRIRRMSKGRR